MADGRDEKVWTVHAEQHKDYTKPHHVADDALLRIWLEDTKAKKVLDLGCGSGLWMNLFKGCEYTGADQNAAMIGVAKARYPNESDKFVQVNWSDSGFKDGEFDLVFTSAVIQHNTHPDKDKVVQSIVRMLKPGGHYMMTECTFRPDNYHHAFPGKPGFHDNLDDGYSFTKNGWIKYMKKFGLELVKSNDQSEYLWRKV